MSVAASERVVVLMRPDEKARLELKARERGVSVGEFVRRSVEDFEPLGREGEIDLLLEQLEASNARAQTALERAKASIDATLRYFDGKARHGAG